MRRKSDVIICSSADILLKRNKLLALRCDVGSVHLPEEELQLAVEVPDERAPGNYLSVAVVER